jgi:outer membrane protein TolC
MTKIDNRDEVEAMVKALHEPVMLHTDAEQTNAQRRAAAAMIGYLTRQLAEAQAALQQIIDLPGDAIDQAPGIAINALEQQKPCPC